MKKIIALSILGLLFANFASAFRLPPPVCIAPVVPSTVACK